VRLRQAVTAAAEELAALRDGAREANGRTSLLVRVRDRLNLSAIDARRPATRDACVAADGDAGAGGVVTQLRVLTQRLDRAEEALRRLEETAPAESERRAAQTALAARIPIVTSLIERTLQDPTMRVSVVLATRNRSSSLRTAINSVREQDYPVWELVAVDDGSTDDTPTVLSEAAATDDRIVVITRPHRGVGAARNAGLAAATGDIVCYLDDDNVLQPIWLKAVVWAFERQIGLELLYGARVKDSEVWWEQGDDALPHLNFEPFDRARLEEGNFIDLGVVAHRRGLAEARFDESLNGLGDWDLLLRMTGDRVPLALPVVAMVYFTNAPGRITTSGRQQEADPLVRAKLARRQARAR